MIQAKVFELRDSATFIPVIAVLVDPCATEGQEAYLLKRCGYPYGEVNVILMNADGRARSGNGCCDPYEWNDRTYQTAHNFIIDNWYSLKDGQVIDVEFILSETKQPKVSESHG